MGFAREYDLHHFTRRLMTWRDDFGSESAWSKTLGYLVSAKGADELWPALTSI